MNWLIVQFWVSMMSWFHCSSVQLWSGWPGRWAATNTGSASLSRGALATIISRSTGVSHGRSVSPFHWAPLAFS
jgi:hypothetical protein